MRKMQRTRTKALTTIATRDPVVVTRHSCMAAKQRVAAHRRDLAIAADEGRRAADLVERARAWLQRRGLVVFRASVIGGPAGCWKIDGRRGWAADDDIVATAGRHGFHAVIERALTPTQTTPTKEDTHV